MDTQKMKELMHMAIKARDAAYVPYSGFGVGAALLTDTGKIYTGCNIENASFPATVCAERTAIFKAVSEGERAFSAIAVCGGPMGEPLQFCPPCGVCRQVMVEFVDVKNFIVILKDPDGTADDDIRAYPFPEILPNCFGPGNMK